MTKLLLHGTLEVTIFEVDRLHTGSNFDFLRKGASRRGKKFLALVKRHLLFRPEIVGTRLYATVDLDRARVGRTRMIQNQHSNPKWNEKFRIHCAHEISDIIFTVKDDDPIGATLIGRAYVPVEQVIKGHIFDRFVEILDENHHPIPGGSKIHVRLQFLDVTADGSCHWSQGIIQNFPGVPHTFFNQRQGCDVTLYQDAHFTPNYLPWIPISSGIYYEPGKCWEDIFTAIRNAQHLIYITGWSVYTKITLIRDPRRKNEENAPTLGELLKMRADQGVKVLMLVWNDITSDPTLKTTGMMATHDEDTANYFRKTKVHCVLCPRYPDGGKSVVQGFQTSTMFTHHQKAVVVDREVPGGRSDKRRIVSFIGGIDLCNGRYDTQAHHLFATLGTVHSDDFHQPNFPGASIKKGGPREPWHDIHCQLEGPIAWDVLYNFEQRWEKQAGQKQSLFSLTQFDEFLVPPSAVTTSDDRDTWAVQLFRSIDGGAVSGFPRTPKEAAELGLVSGKDNIIDRSIQDAYIYAVRRAQKFIYIENQYFLGSSYGWKASDIKVEDIGALHIIPKELSLKIVSKIEAEERFSVYIVIPMWPEGDPESAAVQKILEWQRRTMEMMYTDIAAAIQKKGSRAHPRDYLTFFCLGNRERKIDVEYTPPEAPETDSNYARAQKARRFMIYVHAKMMIVDDEYIIIGSANINQRSMDGGRDTEIAMGAFQPHHIAACGRPPRGQIYGFRRALWYEHLGNEDTAAFENPESEECIRFVNELAEENWKVYSKETFDENELSHHLLRYPAEVNENGAITTLPGFECFPDTKAPILGPIPETKSPILGSRSDYLPSILTT